MVRVTIFVFCGLIGWPNFLSAQAADWRLEGDENGIQVYTRLVGDNEDMMAVRVVTEVSSTLAKIQRYLNDPKRYPEWVHRCSEARKFNEQDVNNYHYSSGVDLPFPFKDREVVARITQRVDPETGVLHRRIEATPDEIPPTDGYDRVRTYDATYTVTPLKEGRWQLECIVRTDAGSGLPNWLRRQIMTGGPAKSMQNLVTLVE